MILFFLVVLIVQSTLGTMVRMHVDDISKILNYDQRETWLADSPVVFMIHRSFSWMVLLFVLLIAWQGRNALLLKNKIFLLAGIILLSMITGITLFYAHMPAVAQPIHLLLATMAITQTFSILLQTRQQTR